MVAWRAPVGLNYVFYLEALWASWLRLLRPKIWKILRSEMLWESLKKSNRPGGIVYSSSWIYMFCRERMQSSMVKLVTLAPGGARLLSTSSRLDRWIVVNNCWNLWIIAGNSLTFCIIVFSGWMLKIFSSYFINCVWQGTLLQAGGGGRGRGGLWDGQQVCK